MNSVRGFPFFCEGLSAAAYATRSNAKPGRRLDTAAGGANSVAGGARWRGPLAGPGGSRGAAARARGPGGGLAAAVAAEERGQ